MRPDAWATPMAMEFPPPCVYEFFRSPIAQNYCWDIPSWIGSVTKSWMQRPTMDYYDMGYSTSNLEVEIGSVIYVRFMFRDLFRTVSGAGATLN